MSNFWIYFKLENLKIPFNFVSEFIKFPKLILLFIQRDRGSFINFQPIKEIGRIHKQEKVNANQNSWCTACIAREYNQKGYHVKEIPRKAEELNSEVHQ